MQKKTKKEIIQLITKVLLLFGIILMIMSFVVHYANGEKSYDEIMVVLSIIIGGITAGFSQVASAGFKVATNIGLPGGKNSGIQVSKNLKVFSPNASFHTKDIGGTLFNYNGKFRMDVGSSSLLHTHGFNMEHFPFGTIVSGIYGGIVDED